MSDSFHSFVLLTCDNIKLDSVINELKNIPIVSDAKQMQGMYDIVVKLNSSPKSMIEEIIRTKIRYVDGVRSTLTLLVQ